MRKATGDPVIQGSTDAKHYSFDWTANGTPDSASCAVYDTSTRPAKACPDLLVGSTILDGAVVITPKVSGLMAGKMYRLICTVTIEGNTLSSYSDISCEL